MNSGNQTTLPLAGLRVVDLTRNLSGPYCTMMLGDMGAEVIKVERPGAGDELRHLYRFPGRAADSQDFFALFNRNKRSLAIDLKTDQGRHLVMSLVQQSDVFVQNLAPGAADRLGLDWHTLRAMNDKLVYVSISGFGPDDPRRAYDGVIQAASGIMDQTGYADGPPAANIISIADLSAAMFAAYATVSALIAVAKGGRGSRIDVAMMDSVLALYGAPAAMYFAIGQYEGRRGTESPHRVPSNVFETSDHRYVFLVSNNEIWPRICRALSLETWETDPRFETNQARVQNRKVVNRTLAKRIRELSTLDVCARLAAHDVPHSIVATLPEVLDGEYVAKHQMVVEIGGGLRGSREPTHVMGIPYKMSAGQPAVRLGPPELGEANEYVMHDILGYPRGT